MKELMKAPRRRPLRTKVELRLDKTTRDDMNATALPLNGAGDAQQQRGLRDDGVALEDALPDDEVHEPGFVLERIEGDASRGGRVLAADGHADVAGACAVLELAHFGGSGEATPR